MSSQKTHAKSSSSSQPPAYLTGDGVDQHAIKVRSRLYPYAQKNLDENVLHLLGNTLVLGPHWFGHVPEKIAILFKEDAEAMFLSQSFPTSEVRNSIMKWSDWIDKLLPRYGDHWKRAGFMMLSFCPSCL